MYIAVDIAYEDDETGSSPDREMNSNTVVSAYRQKKIRISERPTAVYFERTRLIMMRVMTKETIWTTRTDGSGTSVSLSSMFREKQYGCICWETRGQTRIVAFEQK